MLCKRTIFIFLVFLLLSAPGLFGQDRVFVDVIDMFFAFSGPSFLIDEPAGIHALTFPIPCGYNPSSPIIVSKLKDEVLEWKDWFDNTWGPAMTVGIVIGLIAVATGIGMMMGGMWKAGTYPIAIGGGVSCVFGLLYIFRSPYVQYVFYKR